MLFFDAGMDGQIKESREYVFTEWDPTAKDDMAALRARFDRDANGVSDGKLTSADVDWAKFKVMVTNPDGSQTAKTLTQLGITEINPKTDATEISYADGSRVTGQTGFGMGGAGRRRRGLAGRYRRHRSVHARTVWKFTESQETVNLCSSKIRKSVSEAIRWRI